MMKDQFKNHTAQVKSKGAEITDKLFRAKRLTEKGHMQKMRGGAENSYGDFKDTIQHDNDFEEDIRYANDFSMGSRDE